LQIEINTIRFILGLLNILSLKGTGKTRTVKLAKLYEKKDGQVLFQILGFGIFMGGITASVGIVLGLNLDIRHITFYGVETET
jgi:site-specific recombinase